MCITYDALLTKSLENLQSKKSPIRKPGQSRLAQSQQFDSFVPAGTLGHGALWEQGGQVSICPAARETDDAFPMQWAQGHNQKSLFNSGEAMFPVMFPQEIAQDASKILLERLEEQPTTAMWKLPVTHCIAIH